MRMKRIGLIGAWVVVLALAAAMPLAGQGTLSQQVLQLLSRTNSWIGENTFYDFRIPIAAVPSDTDQRIYTDPSGNLYYDGGQIAGSGGGVTPHNLLSTTHPDTAVASPTRGSVVVGNSTPAWARVTPTTGFVQYNGTDTVFSTSLANGTAIPAAQLTGTLPAIPGASLTTLNASSLSTGTVPLARLAGITNTEISAAAAIAYSKLNLAGLVNLSTDTAATALPFTKGGTGLTTAADDTAPVSSGSAWVATALPDCTGGTAALQYTAATNLYSCGSISAGTGTVTSAALSLPGIFSVAGSPITSAGTFAVSLATQVANRVWAGPAIGADAAPTFRALVNADLPASGVAAGTYASVTANDRGVITSASATVNMATQTTGTLAAARGGLGITAVTDDTTIVANGAAWVSTALPDCTRAWAYTASTNLFSCSGTFAVGTVVASSPIAITGTYNNAAVNFNLFDVNATDTASTAASTIATFRTSGTNKHVIYKDGTVAMGAIAFASLPAAPVNGMLLYCSDCTYASNPCTGGSTGAFAKRISGAWRCD